MRRSVTTRNVAIIIALIATAPSAFSACHRRKAGLCRTHTDCNPGYDCAAGKCAKRPPLPSDHLRPQPIVDQAPAPVEAHAPAPTPAAPPLPPPPVKTFTPPPPSQQPTPPIAPPPSDRLPRWKERLKNT
jgi:hypothetical protein